MWIQRLYAMSRGKMKDYKEFPGYKRTLAGRNILFLATVGSGMLGLSTDDKSDVDEMGVCLETPAQLLGFAPFEHDVYRSAVERTHRTDAKSEPGDVDLTIYGLRKFVRLALAGNPNIISLLYLPKNRFSVYTDTAQQLQELADSFASKEVGKAFLGYLHAQRMRLAGSRGQMGVNRDDLVQQHGYDTKYAMHALRLGIQGYQFTRNGRLTLTMNADHIKFLSSVRSGNTPYSTVIDSLQRCEEDIKMSLLDSGLPDKPDYATVENWLLGVYNREWCKDSI
jgi:uncharacterized protein